MSSIHLQNTICRAFDKLLDVYGEDAVTWVSIVIQMYVNIDSQLNCMGGGDRLPELNAHWCYIVLHGSVFVCARALRASFSSLRPGDAETPLSIAFTWAVGPVQWRASLMLHA